MREALTFETNNKYFVLFDVQAYLVGHGFELFQKLVSENGNFIVISNCPPIFQSPRQRWEDEIRSDEK